MIRKNSTESLFVNMIHKKPVTSCRLGQYTNSGTKINSFQIQAEGGEEYESLPKILCLGTTLLGLVLVGLGAFLLATGFSVTAITIGVIVAGVYCLLSAVCANA